MQWQIRFDSRFPRASSALPLTLPELSVCLPHSELVPGATAKVRKDLTLLASVIHRLCTTNSS
jgi:hypothetical protein